MGITNFVCVIGILAVCITLFGCSRPFSPLYKRFHSKDAALKTANRLNSFRMKRAMSYFDELRKISMSRDTKERIKNKKYDIVVAIVTVARTKSPRDKSKGYLIQTAATLDAAVKLDKGKLRKLLIVCNADANPKLHKDAVFLQKYILYANRKKSNIIELSFPQEETLRNSKLTDVKRRTEIKDYIFCLNIVSRFKTKYVLVVEDDVVPHGDMFTVIEHTLRNRLVAEKDEHNNDVLGTFGFIKLYYPQRWQGFALEKLRIVELVSIGLVLGIMLAVLFSFATCHIKARNITLVQYMVWIAISVVTALLVGRVHLLEIRRLSPWLYDMRPSPACCTQAMLYRSEIFPALIDYFRHNSTMNKDLSIHEFSARSGMRGYQLEPNLFLHTGMHTSLSVSSDDKDPYEFLFDMPFDIKQVFK